MCKPVHHEVEFDVPPSEVYDAYLDSRRHSQFTGQKARMSRREGGQFTAGDEYITGVNVELVPDRRIVQAWRASEWPEGAHSILRLELSRRGKGSLLVVDHLGIPEEFREGVDDGWRQFYWEPMRRYFGGGPSRPSPRRRTRR
jgi:activator of HSP90 ATPase